ncbi:hypothetical protein MKW98_011299 [Papaver atlanticum]|uniref:F-box domain-containing protein n=1 Tax=Papaver atlanticum TaxID=357466 RepID=A0AAD4SV99_9MAGN|nr:hypothetical protein MKW98_011299 [Papaver atlanticum]
MELKQSVGDKDEDEECQVVVQEIEKLPSDAIDEILIRVNLGNLLRQCQWVCKDWHKLIVCDKKFNKSILRELPHRYIHIGCSSQYGSLICCIDKATDVRRIPVYYVCKPATREWRKIPIPKTRLTTNKIGIVVTQSYPILHYKILRISVAEAERYGRMHCEVFDSSNWTWKRQKCIKLHWLTSYNQVFVYHVDQDKWAIIKITEEHSSFAVDCNGELGILYSTKKSMEIWTLENYSTTDPIWKRKYYNDVPMMHQNGRGGYPVHMWSGDTVTFLSVRELMWFNCNTNTFTATKFPWNGCMADQPYAFHPYFSYF